MGKKNKLDVIIILFILLALFPIPSFAKIGNKIHENERQYGKELEKKQFSEQKKDFAGKIYYNFPLQGWQIIALYRDGKVISETIRPRGHMVKKDMISEREANAIADIGWSRKKENRR